MIKVKPPAAKSARQPTTPKATRPETGTAWVEDHLTIAELPLSPKTRQILRKDTCKTYHVEFDTFVMVVSIDRPGLTLMLHTKPSKTQIVTRQATKLTRPQLEKRA